MKKIFIPAMMTLALCAGFTACTQDYTEKTIEKGVTKNSTTFMSVAFTIATPPNTRAENKDEASRYQYGTWNGRDKISTVDVYVFDKESGKLEKYHSYTGRQMRIIQNATGDVKISANEAFKISKGLKHVFVVVNPTPAGESFLPREINRTTFEDFKKEYESAHSRLQVYNRPKAPVEKTRADEVASVDGQDDVIMMTGLPAIDVNIEDNINQQQAISGRKNQVKLTVERTVARVVVTTNKDVPTFEIKGDDPRTEKVETDFLLATLSEITYTVAQSNKNFYFLKKEYATPGRTQDNEGEQKYEESPAFSTKTSADPYWYRMNNYVGVSGDFDYSGLWRNAANFEHNKQGFEVKSRDAFLNAADKEKEEIGEVTSHITSTTGDHGLFLFPSTHKYGATVEESEYLKSNTPYILVRGIITPKLYVDANGNFQTDDALKGKDFYLGTNGIVYATKEGVTDEAHNGYKGQYAKKYVKGKAIYYLWIHPDQIDNPINSPVERNNIYHVQIKGVRSFGANWNPLVPYEYNLPYDPKNGKFPPNPFNPDDRPNDNELEPIIPPVNPNEGLTPKETWMSAEVKIVPWKVHSYEAYID